MPRAKRLFNDQAIVYQAWSNRDILMMILLLDGPIWSLLSFHGNNYDCTIPKTDTVFLPCCDQTTRNAVCPTNMEKVYWYKIYSTMASGDRVGHQGTKSLLEVT